MSDESPAEIKHFRTIAGRKVLVTEQVEPGSASAAFLYRMEQVRLAQASQRPLDLRLKGHADCAPYEYQGLTHYLDETGRLVFEAALAEYGGVYTEGVYERVSRAAPEDRERALRLRKAIAQKIHSQMAVSERLAMEAARLPLEPACDVEILPFGYSSQRKETRLIYVTGVTLLAAGIRYKAKTSDLSVSGLKLTLPAVAPVSVGMSVAVHFESLEQSERYPHEPQAYRIVKIGEQNGKPRLYVQRISDAPGAEDFAKFLEGFIEANSRRYPIDLEDAVLALKSRVYGQLYAQVMAHIPFFLRGRELVLFGQNPCNSRLLSSTAAEPGEAMSLLLNSDRLSELIHRADREQGLLLYAYTGEQDSGAQFFNAAEPEFLSDNAKAAFVARGRESGTLRIFLARLRNLQTPQPARIAEIGAELQQHAPELVAELEANFAGLTYAGALFDVTEQALASQPRIAQAEMLEALALDSEAAEPAPSALTLPSVQLGYRVRRGESRFLHETEVQLTAAGATYSGMSVDFSVQGMRLKLDETVLLAAGEPVRLSLTSLAKRVKGMVLSDLPYKVVRVGEDGQTVTLRCEVRQGAHDGAEFFRKLIEANRERLALDNSEWLMQAKALRMEALVSDNLFGLPFAISRDNARRHWLTKLGYCASGEELLWFFRDEGGEYDFTAVGSPTILKALLSGEDLTAERTPGTTHTAELYLFKDYDESAQVEQIRSLSSRQLSPSGRNKFLAAVASRYDYRFLAVWLMSINAYPKADFDEELQFIRLHARHRASQLFEEFHNLVGFGELLDLSALIRRSCH